MRVAAVVLCILLLAPIILSMYGPGPTEPLGSTSDAPGTVGELAQLTSVESSRTPQPRNPVAKGETKARPQFELPPNSKAMTILAEVSDELAGAPRFGTKVDVLLLLHGRLPAGQPKLVCSGVYVLPHSMINTLNEDTGESVKIDKGKCIVVLGLTLEQVEKVAAADVRGSFRIVPMK